MAKMNFKDLLLQKGEKFLLFACLGLFALLTIWGISSMMSVDSPDKIVKTLQAKSSAVTSSINNTSSEPEALPEWVEKQSSFVPISPELFSMAGRPFEAVEWPSLRRENPVVMAPIESQINLVRGAVRGFDRRFEFRNGEEYITLGLLDKREIQKEDKDKLKETLSGIKKKNRNRNLQGNNQPPFGGGFGGPGEGGPGGEGGFGPGEGGSGEGSPYFGSGYGNISGQTGVRTEPLVIYLPLEEAIKKQLPEAVAVRPMRFAIVQLSFPVKEQLKEIQRALRLPSIAAAIQESGPRQQNNFGPGGGIPGGGPPGRGGNFPGGSPAQSPLQPGGRGGPQGPGIFPGGPGAPQGPGGAGFQGSSLVTLAPEFTGMDVMRRVILSDGSIGPWQPFDHAANFFDEFLRYDTPMVVETGYLPYFTRMEQGLTSPIPALTEGLTPNYPPDVQMASIYANYTKLKEANKPPQAEDQYRARFDKSKNSNPYSQGALGNGSGNLSPGYGGGEGNEFGGGFTGGPGYPGGGTGGLFPGGGSFPGGPGSFTGPGGTGDEGFEGEGSNNPQNYATLSTAEQIEFLLLRFLDTQLQPGRSYQYKVRLRMRNPNYKKKDLVAVNADAEKEEIEGAWYECPQTLNVPPEFHMYAYSSDEYVKKIDTLYEDAGKVDLVKRVFETREVTEGNRAVVSIQQWLPEVMMSGNSRETIGAWVQAEVPVSPGEFIGRSTLVPLPIWSSATGAYVMVSRAFQKNGGIVGFPTGQNKTPPPGRVLDLTTKNILIDFDGGKTRTKVGNVYITDDSATELLILTYDGKIEVLNQLKDSKDKKRQERESIWTTWIEKVKARKAEGEAQQQFGGPGEGGEPGRGDR